MCDFKELPEIAESMLRDIKKEAIKISDSGDEEIVDKVQEIINFFRFGEIKLVRQAVKKIRYNDLRRSFYLIIAIISEGEKKDVKILRKAVNKEIKRFGGIQTGFLIFIAKLSGKRCDLKRVRQAIEKNDPFSQVHDYLTLFGFLGQKEDLQKARQAAKIEVPGKPFFKTAGLMIIAAFTGATEDFQELARALIKIDRVKLRRRIPGDINIDSILEKSVDFKSANKAVSWIDDDYLRAMVWTLIAIDKIKIVRGQRPQ